MTASSFASLLVALLALAAFPAHAAEDYDNCTDFIDSVPATISTQGVWCLRDNLATSLTAGTAVTIAANNVTVDCNDFKIGGLGAGPASQAVGLATSGARQNTTVRNCSIRGFRYGVMLDGAGHLVEDNQVESSLEIGLVVLGDNNVVRHNRIRKTGSDDGGIGIYASADIIDNTVTDVFGITEDGFIEVFGILLLGGPGHEVRDNIVRDLYAPAFTTPGDANVIGIWVTGEAHATLADTRVVDDVSRFNGISNTGIEIGTPGSSFCTGNTVAGFVDPFSTCVMVGGNHSN